MEKFGEDLNFLLSRLTEGESNNVKEKLDRTRDRLLELRARNLVKINHSAMELLCAKHLVRHGYEIDVEHPLNDLLTCDIYGAKGDGNIIVEVETGYIPPEHALDPGAYNRARIVSKIARYSQFSNKFILGTPPTNMLPIPPLFQTPPRYRRTAVLLEMKTLCDRYYARPPIELEEIKLSRLYTIYILDVDNVMVTEVDLDAYLEALSAMPCLANNPKGAMTLAINSKEATRS